MSSSVSQIALVLAVVSIIFTLATLAVVVFGILRTRGTTRTLILAAGVLMLISQLVTRFLPVLLPGLGIKDHLLIIVTPTVLLGLFGLATTTCLVLAAVRARDDRQEPGGPAHPQRPSWQGTQPSWPQTQPPPRDPH